MRKYSKTDHRYWIPKLFKPTRGASDYQSPFWSVRLQYQSERTTFSLGTENKAAAAARARDIYVFLLANGWEKTLEEFKGKTPAPEKKSNATIGEFLAELATVADLKKKTLESYAIALRTIVSQIFGIDGGTACYDYASGGRQKWIEKIHAIKLGELTAARVHAWKRDFLSRAGSSPIKQRTAKISVNSLMRRAKSLFAPDAAKHLRSVVLPSPLPFEGVAFEPRVSQRYRSAIDVEALIAAAREELALDAPEEFKVFILALFAGLRRGEIDKLAWDAFHFDKSFLRIQATKYFAPKSEDSIGDVPLEPELVELFRGFKAKATGEFVIESPNIPRLEATYENYRCQAVFESLISWLRHKGVKTKTPLHTLRKEYGSLLNQKFGIHAASLGLRHASLAVTTLHYVDSRPQATTGLGGLLTGTVTLVKFGRSVKGKEVSSKS
jgi:integrase